MYLKLDLNLFRVLTLYFSLLSVSVFSQAIINTENMMASIDNDWSYNFDLKGNLAFGNINLVNFNTTHQLAKKSNNHLFRIMGNYSYITQNSVNEASDYTTQLRYNYFIKRNSSLFLFFQAQNIKSIRMNQRILFGGGFRKNIFKNENNYLDISLGLFNENELYDKNTVNEVKIHNLRYSLSLYSKLQITKKFFINNVIYYQLNSDYFGDSRLFIEPRMYYKTKSVDFFVNFVYWLHSTPYIDVINHDGRLMFGIDVSL